MRTRRVPLVIAAYLAVAVLVGPPARPAHAQAPIALLGQVTSGPDSAMEGVLISAKKTGSTVTITVVSDAQGRYRFPATTEYMLPRSTNVRRVFVDNSTTPPTFWVGNNHGASVIKLEPLD